MIFFSDLTPAALGRLAWLEGADGAPGWQREQICGQSVEYVALWGADGGREGGIFSIETAAMHPCCPFLAL